MMNVYRRDQIFSSFNVLFYAVKYFLNTVYWMNVLHSLCFLAKTFRVDAKFYGKHLKAQQIKTSTVAH